MRTSARSSRKPTASICRFASCSWSSSAASARYWARFSRSEEHTSELQSRGHLVCRLLLEKKKHLQANEISESVNRVCEQGDARRIFAILPKCPQRRQDPLATSLLTRVPPPVPESQAAMAS